MIFFIKHLSIKKAVSVVAFAALAFTFGGMTAYAEGEFDIQSQYEASGAEAAFDGLPDYVCDGLDSAGIDVGDISTAGGLSAAGVGNSVISMAGGEVTLPLAALGAMMALLLFASVCRSGESAAESSLSPSLNAVTSLAVGITLVVPISALVDAADDATGIACRFNEAFGAVFAGILIANGQTASAAGYGSFLTGAVNAASLGASEIVMPMLRVFLALSCVSAISGSVKTDAVIRFFEKYAKWLLGFMAVMISTVLGISGIISASADSVGADRKSVV